MQLPFEFCVAGTLELHSLESRSECAAAVRALVRFCLEPAQELSSCAAVIDSLVAKHRSEAATGTINHAARSVC
jgi:hypothetical protein